MQQRRFLNFFGVVGLSLTAALAVAQDPSAATPAAEPAAETPPPIAEATPAGVAPPPISAAAPAGADHLRVSALINFSGGVKAGMVDTRDGSAFFIGIGERRRGVTLEDADFEKEEVVLSKDGVAWRLKLEDDPDALDVPIVLEPAPLAKDPSDPTWKGEGIERFLAEHPEAVIKGNMPTLVAPPPNAKPVEGFGPGIEAFLKDDPELRDKLMQPVVGRGETIERFLSENPELAAELDKPITGKGPGIEKFLKENPDIETGPGIPPEALPPEVRKELYPDYQEPE